MLMFPWLSRQQGKQAFPERSQSRILASGTAPKWGVLSTDMVWNDVFSWERLSQFNRRNAFFMFSSICIFCSQVVIFASMLTQSKARIVRLPIIRRRTRFERSPTIYESPR